LAGLVLIVFSAYFYAWQAANYLILMGVLAALTILSAFLITKFEGHISNIVLKISIISVILVLVFFKYTNLLFATDIIFPIGLSFFVFRIISYIIDVYKKKIQFDKNIIKTLVYLTFFAHIISGPIERYDDFYKNSGKFNIEIFTQGLERFIIGLGKKILIADALSHMMTSLDIIPISKSPASFLWIMSIIYSLQLYYDFSGYSDMAIGITEIFGFRCRENFNYPYMTKSISEFWKRWHISLGTWFRDYVYIPMGGSREGKKRLILNLFVVWLLTGIWHGSKVTFIIWGLSYFVLILFEKLILHPEKFGKIGSNIYRLFTLFFINLLWIVFRSNDVGMLSEYLRRMFGISGIEGIDVNVWMLVWDYKYFILAAILFSFPVFKMLQNLIKNKSEKIQGAISIVSTIVLLALFVLCISFIVTVSNNPFVYQNF
jgi:Predicted membrane protein involved in D-alanine export